jgi:hypothetical protein
MLKHLFRAMAAICVIVVTAPAWAGSEYCAQRDQVVERLAAHYKEQPSGRGLQAREDRQELVEVWASRETGTFTVMLTTPDGMSCVLATGTDWQFDATPPLSSDRSS